VIGRGRSLRFTVVASILVAGGCAQVIGADGYSDAVDALCMCPELAAISDCTTVAHKRLTLAKAPEKAAWLDRYAATCAGSCGPSALVCFDGEPVCTPPGEECFASEECCGYTQGGGCCPDALAPSGSSCCARCRTCSEVLDEDPSSEPLCSTATEILLGALACLCDTCASVCADNCPSGPFTNLTAACAVCFDAATRLGGACYDEFLVCAADVPYAP
jgi:hypothetical protein